MTKSDSTPVSEQAKPWFTTAIICKRDFGNDQCTCCDRRLTGAVRMLELDQRTQTYHDRRDVPTDKSQGWFPFGLKCARTKLKEHSAQVVQKCA